MVTATMRRGSVAAAWLLACLLAASGGEAKKTFVVLHQSNSTPAACPAVCRCYINILSCHPEKPLGSHVHDSKGDRAGAGAGQPPPSKQHGKSQRNDTQSNATGSAMLTRIPEGPRGTMLGNVLTAFTVLDFRDNNISFIWKNNWIFFTMTEYLNLKGNHITDLIPETFEGLSQLKYFDVSNNRLFAIQRDLFQTKHGLLKLKVLDLSSNDILVLGPSAFSQLTNLHFMNISDNYLSLIGNGAFQHLSSIIYLDLRATSISLDVLRAILQSTTNIVNLYISHTLKCCLCKFPLLNHLILPRKVEINCKNIYCTVTLIQCYTKEIEKNQLSLDKERIVQQMKAIKAGAVSSLPGRDELERQKQNNGAHSLLDKYEQVHKPDVHAVNVTLGSPEMGIENLNQNLQLGGKEIEVKEAIDQKNDKLLNIIRHEEETERILREKQKQHDIEKLSSSDDAKESWKSELNNEEDTLDKLHKLKETLKSLYHYATERIESGEDDKVIVKLDS
ncbi:leucine-rich repeat-containing protein 37B-like isoform X2 [Callorhinchus milii]|uniref:Leucine-rich repeat-containing protein 37B-like n=1 Tax=Callorhinchus milii TaxID=7868 RepID=A0A4W3GMR2_CALMI|nr:leucine-rich repeat-containing protein 37B-like isoform X2 [Callorhinchus milii]|eukprot:gi/632966401/ref/XP_007899396.1/ PREDICTED: leucine-rich repeat-containing protein 37B-like isoform X2 [Callorhinchus milii]